MTFRGKHALVVGLGESGKAAARFLAARGARVAVADRRSDAGNAAAMAELAGLDLEYRFGAHGEGDFLGYDLIVPSPGVPWNLPALEAARHAGAEVRGELDLAADELRGRAVGITGSNGKTTTTALTGHILAEAGLPVVVAGNIGTPVLAVVDGSRDEQWNVLELSSFQLEASERFRCHIAAVLNVTPDHLDRHGNFEAYAAAKARIFAAQTASDFAVLNAADATCRSWAPALTAAVRRFGRGGEVRPGTWAADGAIVRDGERVSDLELPIRGAHNLENALAAVEVCALAGVPVAAIERGLHGFRAVEHRLELVARLDGVDYYNDSKATNVDATIKAVESFDGGLWLILGGRDKDSDYRALAPALRGKLRQALLIGEAAAKIREHLGGEFPLADCGALGTAVERARAGARAGETVLLSPACASFDQFENYGHRGREFKRIVAGWTAGN